MERYSEYKDSGIQWIGEIPSHWKTPTIGRLFDIKAGGDAKPEYYSYEKDEKHPYPVYTNTKDDNSVYAFTSKPFFPAQTITVTGRGDIGRAIYRTIPYDAIIRLLSLCPRIKLNAKFFTYFINVVIPFTSDSAAIGQLSAVQIKPKVVTFPPLPEQDSIVAYLDTQTSRIDSFIANVEREIELLGEAKQRIIADAVTKGLKKDVEMRDSGVEWIGKIPKTWEIRRIKTLFVEENELNKDLNYELLTFSRSKGIIPYASLNDKEPSASDLTKYKVIHPGQLLENRMQAWSGMFGCSYIEGCVSPDYSVFSPINENVNVQYYEYVFRTPIQVQIFANASKGIGTGFNRLYTPQFYNIYTWYPPIEEQKEIVNYISKKTSQIDTLISSLSQQITSLKEYKQRLISDVVTGQIKVC